MIVAVAAAAVFLLPLKASAQFSQNPPETHDSTVVLTLEDALKIALSENVSVKVADQEINGQHVRGPYGSGDVLYPAAHGPDRSGNPSLCASCG